MKTLFLLLLLVSTTAFATGDNLADLMHMPEKGNFIYNGEFSYEKSESTLKLATLLYENTNESTAMSYDQAFLLSKFYYSKQIFDCSFLSVMYICNYEYI